MYNTDTFYGVDGELTLANPAPFDADELTKYFGEGGIVGRVTDISLNVGMDIKAFHELGSRTASDLRAGNINISGTVERAFINGALLRLMLGEYSSNKEGGDPFGIPSFDMTVTLNNPKHEGEAGVSFVTVYGVMFDGWRFNLPEDDFVLEKVSFKAKRIELRNNEVES